LVHLLAIQVSSDQEILPVLDLQIQVKQLREDLLGVVLAEVPWVLDHQVAQVIEDHLDVQVIEDHLLQVALDL
jgi:hypothetical protein